MLEILTEGAAFPKNDKLGYYIFNRPDQNPKSKFSIALLFAINTAWVSKLNVSLIFVALVLISVSFFLNTTAPPYVLIWICLTHTIKLHCKGPLTVAGGSLECFISFAVSNDDVSERPCFQQLTSLHCWLISFVTRCESRYLFCLRLDEKAPRRWMINLIRGRSGCCLQTETNGGGKCGGQRYICTRRRPTCKTMLHTLLLTMPH